MSTRVPIELTLNSPWYEHVRDGRKHYEGRRWNQKLRQLQPGDIIVFRHHLHPTYPPLPVIVEKVLSFPSYRAALQQLVLHDVLPEVDTVDEGDLIYQRFVSLSTQSREGVCMIQIRLIH